MCRFVLLTIFSFNILSNPFNCPSTRGSLLSIAFLQSYKKAVDEVSDIFSLHLSVHFRASYIQALICCPSHLFLSLALSVFNRSLINISHHLSFLNSPPIFLSVCLLHSFRRGVSHHRLLHFSPSHQFVTVVQCP